MMNTPPAAMALSDYLTDSAFDFVEDVGLGFGWDIAAQLFSTAGQTYSTIKQGQDARDIAKKQLEAARIGALSAAELYGSPTTAAPQASPLAQPVTGLVGPAPGSFEAFVKQNKTPLMIGGAVVGLGVVVLVIKKAKR